MAEEARSRRVRYHCEQSRSNTCLAACVAMVRGRLELLPPEDIARREVEVSRELETGRGGALIELAAAALGSQMIRADPDQPRNLMRLRDDLSSGRWWMVAMMHPGPLADHHASQRPLPRSRHGHLPRPPAPSHATVLVSASAHDVLFLDPWFSSEFQPQRLGWSTFAAAWTGMFIPVALDPG